MSAKKKVILLQYGLSTNEILTCTAQCIISTGVSSPREAWHINMEINLENGPGPRQSGQRLSTWPLMTYFRAVGSESLWSLYFKCLHCIFCSEEYVTCWVCLKAEGKALDGRADSPQGDPHDSCPCCSRPVRPSPLECGQDLEHASNQQTMAMKKFWRCTYGPKSV